MSVWQSLHVLHIWPLYCLPLCLFAIIPFQFNAADHPSVTSLPVDWVAIWIERLWRWLGAIAITSICIAVAKPYLAAQSVEKVGQGAHLMIVLDRSTSMNDPFGKKKTKDSPAKLAVARDVLNQMIQNSPSDLVGLITFSTSPVFVSALTSDKAYLQAGLAATQAGGMGFTAVARGLGMALDYFKGKPVTGSRAILLVSDGGAHLDVSTQEMLRNMFSREQASLYWVYLRSANSISLKSTNTEEDYEGYPEYALHAYFKSLKIPYHVYEAENSQAVSQAMQDIARLKNKPTRYREPVSKQDYSWLFYLLAGVSGLGLWLIHCTEVRQ